jgi:hypothetical protein
MQFLAFSFQLVRAKLTAFPEHDELTSISQKLRWDGYDFI